MPLLPELELAKPYYDTRNFIFKLFDLGESFYISVLAHQENRLCYTEFS